MYDPSEKSRAMFEAGAGNGKYKTVLANLLVKAIYAFARIDPISVKFSTFEKVTL